jgi:predicted HicB family RNase H-like nuclease
MTRRRDKMIHIKIDEELKKELVSEAKARGLSLNAYIRMLLIERNK